MCNLRGFQFLAVECGLNCSMLSPVRPRNQKPIASSLLSVFSGQIQIQQLSIDFYTW